MPVSNARQETEHSPTVDALAGSFDGISGRLVEGWVWIIGWTGRKITVTIFDGERRLGDATANMLRPDLVDAGIGDGQHAFRFALPIEVFDGQEHLLSVKVKGTGYQLPGSPKLFVNRPLTPDETFNFRSAALLSATPPLSDFQFSVLRALSNISENLAVQTRALAQLLERPHTKLDAPIPSPPVALSAPEDLYGPLCGSASAAPAGDFDIVIFSIIDWSFRIQRPQHIATQLAKSGCRVFYVSVHLAEMEPNTGCFTFLSQPISGLFEIRLKCPGPVPSIYSGIASTEHRDELCAALRELNEVVGLRSPVALIEFPSWYPLARSLPGATVVFDCMDHHAGFNNVSPAIVQLEEQLVREADAVIVSSAYLAENVTKVRKCEIIRNGADVEYFAAAPAAVEDFGPGPVIGYHGAISEWFDLDLVSSCARKHPDWTFILVGSTEGCDTSTACALPNVKFLGEKPYPELTRYLYAFDVCLVPFKLVDLIKATNPVKVYEYLCAGKPVVATDIPELRLIPRNLLYLAKTARQFETAISAALKEKPHDPVVDRRRTWASRQSWALRGRRFRQVIDRSFEKVTVVVLCHNNLELTQACAHSLLAFSDYPALEIILVDNASTDDTLPYLRALAEVHPNIRVIANPENLGFAAGNNVGLRATDARYRVVLNNDTYVTKGWIRDLIRPLQMNSDIGMAGPVTNMIGNEQKIRIHYSNMDEMAERAALFTGLRRRKTYETDNLAFFCVAIRSDVIERVGYLDEAYGLGFFEDDDFAQRVRGAGFKLVICDDVFVHHHLSASFDKLGGEKKRQLMERNQKIFERKWGKWKPHKYRDEQGFGE